MLGSNYCQKQPIVTTIRHRGVLDNHIYGTRIAPAQTGVIGMRWNLCCKCLVMAVCVMMLANCAKRSASLLTTPPRAPLKAVPGAAPPPVTESKAKQANRSVARKPASKSSAAAQPAQLTENDAPALRTLAFVVPVEGGAARTDLGATIRDALNALASTELLFECPSQMRAGFGRIDVAYTGFFPGALAALRPLERYMTAPPVGAQYYTLARG